LNSFFERGEERGEGEVVRRLLDASKTVSALLDAGANQDARDRHGDTPLLTAVKFVSANVCETVSALLEAGADVGIRCSQKRSALHWCGILGKERYGTISKEVARLLLRKGADTGARDLHDATPLHTAARSDQSGLVKVLLHARADISAVNRKRETPLHLAAKDGGQTQRVVRILLANGAHLEARDVNQT
jgi:ankyrin repeat protein